MPATVPPRHPRPTAELADLVGLVGLAVLFVVLVGAATTGAGPGASSGSGATPADVAGEDTVVPFSWVASAAAGAPAVTVFDAPDAASGQRALPNPTVTGDPLVLLVDGNDIGRDWLPVVLPVGATGRRGWVRKADVALSPNVYRVDVALGARTLEVREGDEVVIDTPIGVDPGGPPTPGGTYLVEELLRPSDPGDMGTGAGLAGIRVPADVLTEMADTLPRGTPVDVRP